MDELEISGKRYISTARAAKEHRYHADYIGQLVRGGKVVGQKVGRSWYVEVDSLEAYFGNEKETGKPVAIVAPKAGSKATVKEVVEEEADEAPEPVQVEEPNEKKRVTEAEDIDPFQKKFARKPHIIAPVTTNKRSIEVAEIEAEKEEEEKEREEPVELDLVAYEAPAQDITAPTMDEEVFIPVKLEREAPRIPLKTIEDSFYKIPKSGLKYIASRTPKQEIKEVAEQPQYEEKRSRYSMRVGLLTSLVMIVGILSLGGGILLSYYLHSATTVNAGGQVSSLIFSQ